MLDFSTHIKWFFFLTAQQFVVARIFIHPMFNPQTLRNDVAVIRLGVAVPLGQLPTIGTACLPVTPFIGQRYSSIAIFKKNELFAIFLFAYSCWVSGWGKNDFLGVYQTIQKEVDVPILDTARCQAALTATRLGPTFVFDGTSFICAGGEPGKDACTGDGGSPLVCDLNGRAFVAGLASWGIGCAGSNVPGVYVNVLSYIPFIQTSVATL